MASKLTDAQKIADNAIRAFNKQIESAYRNLGYNHQVTRNLVSTARSIFGESNIKYSDRSSTFNYNMVDKATGEILAIPQISRGKKALDAYGIKDKGAKRSKLAELERVTSYRDKANVKQYKRMFDVTKAVSEAARRLELSRKAHIPVEIQAQIDNAKTIAEKNSILKGYVHSYSQAEYQTQLSIDIIAGDIFAKYHSAKEHDEDITAYQEFGYQFNNSRPTNSDEIDTLRDALLQRQVTLNRLENFNNSLEDDTILGLLSEYDL